jgi:hypothetical protein
MIRVALVVALVAACGGDDANNNQPKDSQGCVEAWECSPWETNGSSDNGTRTCVDKSACGTSDTKPIETATLPALDPQFYECSVEPIVVRGCSMLGCHGTETGRGYRLYARGRLRITGQTITEPGCLSAGTMSPSEVCIGNIECKCWSVPQMTVERRRSFDSARGFAIADDGTALPDMTQSQLLRQPQSGGGFAHAGISMWNAGDTDYNTIKMWLEGAQRGSACNSMN